MVDNSDAAAAHLEAGGGRPKEHGTFTIGLRPKIAVSVPAASLQSRRSRRCMIEHAPPACLSSTRFLAAAKLLTKASRRARARLLIRNRVDPTSSLATTWISD